MPLCMGEMEDFAVSWVPIVFYFKLAFELCMSLALVYFPGLTILYGRGRGFAATRRGLKVCLMLGCN